MPKIVWVKGNRGPCPQIVYVEQVTGSGEVKQDVICEHVISQHHLAKGLELDDLAKLYPCTVVS